MDGRALRIPIGAGQFGVLFIAIREGFPVGLASLVIQAQVFFTILLAWLVLANGHCAQIIGAAVGFAGMAVIGCGTPRRRESRAVPAGHSGRAVLGLRQRAGEERRQGRHARLHRLVEPGRAAAAVHAVARGRGDRRLRRARPSEPEARSSACSRISYGGTLFGYGLWARLLAHHSAATVAPFALLVPVVGMIAAALLFGETLTALKSSAALW